MKSLETINIFQLKDISQDGMISDSLLMLSDISPGLLKMFEQPTRLDGCGFVFCLRGEFKMILNMTQYIIRPHNLIVISPGSIIQEIQGVEDADIRILFFSRELARGIDLNSVVPMFSLILNSPCISLLAEEKESLLQFYSFMKQMTNKKSHIYSIDVLRHIMLAMIYETCAIYKKNLQNNPLKLSRKDEILRELLRFIGQYYNEERFVSFYAQKLFLTPKYLSNVTKELTNRTVHDWICAAIILDAKAQLKSTQLTVQQISQNLNFPNSSFFGRFFKKHTGMAPGEFRERVSK